MIRTLRNIFLDDKSKTSTEQGSKLDVVAAALIFEVIRADGKINDSEIVSLINILEHEFEIDKDELDTMLDKAKEASNQTTSLQNLTSKINQQWSNKERQNLLVQLWRMAMADNHVDSHERHIIRRIAGLLYLTESQIYTAKERAKTV